MKKSSLVTIENIEKHFKQIKERIAILLSEEYYNILFDIEPKTSSEKIEQINQIEFIKKILFEEILQTYNEFLITKNLLELYINKENNKRNNVIELSDYDIKEKGIVTITASLLLPMVAPIVISIAVPVIGLDYYLKIINQKMLELNEAILKEYQRVHKELSQFENTLRTDYHSTKKRLEDLKEKALMGEEITNDLLEIVNPESIGLNKISFDITSLEIDAIQYQKK